LVQLTGTGKLPVSVFNGSAALLANNETFTGDNTFSSWSVFTGSVTMSNPLNTLAGNGSAITNLNGAGLTGVSGATESVNGSMIGVERRPTRWGSTRRPWRC